MSRTAKAGSQVPVQVTTVHWRWDNTAKSHVRVWVDGWFGDQFEVWTNITFHSFKVLAETLGIKFKFYAWDEDPSMSKKYWVQLQTPSGDWHDSIGCDDQMECLSHATWQVKQGRMARVVKRTDEVLYQPVLREHKHLWHKQPTRE